MAEKHLLIWDGDCGFCQASADWLMGRDRRGEFESVPAQKCSRPPMTDALFERSRREVLLIKPGGEVLGGADAVFAMLARCGWGVFAKVLALPPLIWVMRMGYRLIANNRHRISRTFLKGHSCKIDLGSNSEPKSD